MLDTPTRPLTASVVAFAITAAALTTIAAPAPVVGQGLGSGESGRRALLPRAEEIALARSAAPDAVSADAEVWVLGVERFERVSRGTNGVACMVARDWLASLEPICYDREAAATIMRIAIRRTELLHGEHSVAEADAIVSTEIASGELRLPQRPALAYMLSSGQRLVAEDGRPVGNWEPHLMLYYPYLTAEALGLSGEGDPGTMIISNGGSASASMVMIVQDFVDPATTPEAR